MDFVCSVCEKKLKSRQALCGHMVVHSKKRTANTINQENKAKHVEEYNAHPKVCKNCGAILTYEEAQLGKVFCNHSCSASYTNSQRGRQKISRLCENCGKEFFVLWDSDQRFCKKKCSTGFRVKQKLEEWLATGEMKGWTGGAHGGAPRSGYVMSYLLGRQDNCCEMCKKPFIWYDKPLPTIMDHKDGDSTNNHPDNLRLLCPNCEATTPTWKGRNKGSGRASKGFLPPYIRVHGGFDMAKSTGKDAIAIGNAEASGEGSIAIESLPPNFSGAIGADSRAPGGVAIGPRASTLPEKKNFLESISRGASFGVTDAVIRNAK